MVRMQFGFSSVATTVIVNERYSLDVVVAVRMPSADRDIDVRSLSNRYVICH